MTLLTARAVTLAAAGAATLACARPQPADIVFRGGPVWTAGDARSHPGAVAVRAGRIVWTGGDDGAGSWIGPGTRVVPLQGRLLLPGFHDAHVHPISSGIEMTELSLNDCDTPAEIAATIRAYLAQEGAASGDAWFVGRGWQLPVFPAANPRREMLDHLVPVRPACLEAADGHSVWVNSAALRLAGITKDTADPPGGKIERDPATGEPSGTLRDTAARLVRRLLPEYTDADRDAGLDRALGEMRRFGITGFNDASASEAEARAYAGARDAGRLTARGSLSLTVDSRAGADDLPRLAALRAKFGGPLLSAGSAKIFVDGVIESRTAALLEPYLGGDPEDRGKPRYTPEALDALVAALDREGFQAHFHAIGDRAVRMSLDAIEKARAQNGPRDARHQIAHLELIDPADIPRFAPLGAAADFQPFWAIADAYITDLTLPVLGPARSRWIYPIRSVAKTGAAVVCGSDWAVTTLNPLDAIQIGVTRVDPENPGSGPFLPEERVDLATMLTCYTSRGAWLDFREKETGAIEAGLSADLIVLDRDLFAIPEAEITKARVVMTFFEGKEVWRDAAAGP